MSTIKVRYIETRYTPEGLPEPDPFQPGKFKVNRGKFTFATNPRSKVTQTFFPGEVFDLPAEHARYLISRHPLMFMEEDRWLALMERLNRAKPNREQERQQYQQMLRQREEERQAHDRMLALAAERDENQKRAALLATEAEQERSAKQSVAQERDVLSQKVEELLAQMMRQQQQQAEEAARRQAELEAMRVEQAARIAELEAKMQQQNKGRGKRQVESELRDPDPSVES